MGEPQGERIIHKAVPRHAAQAFEALADQTHGKVPPFAGSGVAGVKVAVVRDDQGMRVERSPQGRLDVLCALARGLGESSAACRVSLDGGGSSASLATQRSCQAMGSGFGMKPSDAELMQKRSPVGSGPSSNTCPRWAPQSLQRTSTRVIPWV